MQVADYYVRRMQMVLVGCTALMLLAMAALPIVVLPVVEEDEKSSDLQTRSRAEEIKLSASTYISNVFFFMLLTHQSGLRLRYIHATRTTLGISILWVIVVIGE